MAPFPSLLEDHLRSMLISAIAVEEFGMAPYWLSSRTLMTAGFTKPPATNSATSETQGIKVQLVSIPFWCWPLVCFRARGHVSHFPDDRRMLFGVRGVQDFHDAIGNQITVFFQQPVSYFVWFDGLSTSSALCTRCSIALKILGESDSRVTWAVRGEWNWWQWLALWKGSSNSLLMLIWSWLTKSLWEVLRLFRYFHFIPPPFRVFSF